MFKFIALVFAAVLALAVAAPAPVIVSSYSTGVVGAPALAYSAPAVATYAASPIVSSYGVHPYSAYGYGAPVAYY